MTGKLEVWLRGPLSNMPALLQPVAHALLQAREELDKLMVNFPENLLWEKPFGMASVGFHLQHLTGVINRLFTYANGKQLDERQLTYLEAEGKPVSGLVVTQLMDIFHNQVDAALIQLLETSELHLTDVRLVGRKKYAFYSYRFTCFMPRSIRCGTWVNFWLLSGC